MTAEKEQACACVFDALTVARYLRDASIAAKYHRATSTVIYSDFVKEQLPKLEKCMDISLEDVRRHLEKASAEAPVGRFDKAHRALNWAESRLLRAIRKCAKR